MLERLLHLLKSEGMLTTGELARRLGVSPSLVTAMLDDLARRGLLQKTSLEPAAISCPPSTPDPAGKDRLSLPGGGQPGDCTQSCGGCALSGSCKPLLNRSWSL